MKQLVVAASAVALIGVLFAGVSLASGPVAAQAPNARLALLVDGNDAVGSFTVLRKKGVQSVTNPFSGIYCVTPSTTMALSRIVPMVSLEANGSPFSDTTVAWSSLLAFCPPRHDRGGRLPGDHAHLPQQRWVHTDRLLAGVDSDAMGEEMRPEEPFGLRGQYENIWHIAAAVRWSDGAIVGHRTYCGRNYPPTDERPDIAGLTEVCSDCTAQVANRH